MVPGAMRNDRPWGIWKSHVNPEGLVIAGACRATGLVRARTEAAARNNCRPAAVALGVPQGMSVLVPAAPLQSDDTAASLACAIEGVRHAMGARKSFSCFAQCGEGYCQEKAHR